MVDISSSKWSEFRYSLCGLLANIFLDSSNHPKPWCILGILSPQVLMWFGRVHSLEAKSAWIACSLPWLRSCHRSPWLAGCTSAKGSGRIVDCKHEDDESIDFPTCREGGRLASGIGSEDTLQIVEAYERNCWALWQGGGQQVQAQAQVRFKEAEKTVGPRSLWWPELRSCSGDRLDSVKTFQKFICLYGAVVPNLPVEILHHQAVCPRPSSHLGLLFKSVSPPVSIYRPHVYTLLPLSPALKPVIIGTYSPTKCHDWESWLSESPKANTRAFFQVHVPSGHHAPLGVSNTSGTFMARAPRNYRNYDARTRDSPLKSECYDPDDWLKTAHAVAVAVTLSPKVGLIHDLWLNSNRFD